MTGLTGDESQLAAAVAGALVAWEQLGHRAAQDAQAGSSRRAALAADDGARGTRRDRTASAWAVAGRQMMMARAIRAYERRRGH